MEWTYMDIIIAIIGAATSLSIAVFGAIYLNVNNVKLQNRKLKEEHYVNYITALHLLAENNNDKKTMENYTLHRDKIFIIASNEVINAILKYEKDGVGQPPAQHDALLTQIYLLIRKDLKIKDKNFPTLSLK